MSDVQRLTVTQDTEYLGGTSYQAVARCEVLTASGVLFEFLIPRADYTADLAKTEAEGYAAQVESLLTNTSVSGISQWQKQTQSGYLLYMGAIGVQSDSGNSNLTFDVPWGSVNAQVVSGQINDLAKQLNATEAVT